MQELILRVSQIGYRVLIHCELRIIGNRVKYADLPSKKKERRFEA
jgi:hypothetical protein